MQPRNRRRVHGRRCPAGDDAGAFAGTGVVGDAGEMAAQFDHGGKFSVLLEHATDGGGLGFGDSEHGASMESGSATGKHGQTGQRKRPGRAASPPPAPTQPGTISRADAGAAGDRARLRPRRTVRPAVRRGPLTAPVPDDRPRRRSRLSAWPQRTASLVRVSRRRDRLTSTLSILDQIRPPASPRCASPRPGRIHRGCR